MKIIKHKLLKGAVLPTILVYVGIVFITLLIIWLLLWTKPQPQAKLETLIPLKVALAEVVEREVQPDEQVTGRLQPIKDAQIHFEVAGKVISRQVEPGMSVARGEVLLSLEEDDYRNELEQVEADLIIEQQGVVRDKELLTLAKKNLQLQQQEVKRLESLIGDNLIAQSRLDSTRQQVFDLQAEVARLEYSVATNAARVKMKKAQKDLAQRNLTRTVLRAPFNGIVNEVFIDEGDYITANQGALILVDTEEFDVQVDVRGELVAALRLNQKVFVEVNRKVIDGVIIALQHDPDINTNTHQIRVRIPNENIRAGALASVTIPLAIEEKAKLIPVSSIVNLHGNTYVYVFNGNKVIKTVVVVGRRVGNEYILLSGLDVGQKIVARDVLSLVDDQLVVAP
ncbi:MAG: efflux RND transporter periplasmic adaptor subunit [Pseudomonadota bacterium]